MVLNLFSSFVIFLFGLAVGSFLNCVIYRLETGKNFLKGRSHCPDCQHKLGFRDLIPVLSFIILKGKCRYCQKNISWQYPAVELATAITFVLTILLNDTMGLLGSFYFLAMASFLIVIFVYDLKHYIIPDKVIYPAILIALVYDFWKSDFLLLIFGKSDFLLSALAAAGFFLAIVLVSRGRWMGIGDIKLGFLMGLILGFPNILLALFLAFFIGAIIGIGLIFASKKSLKSEVPFGPFLVVGTFIALFWGKAIVEWYSRLLTI